MRNRVVVSVLLAMVAFATAAGAWAASRGSGGTADAAEATKVELCHRSGSSLTVVSVPARAVPGRVRAGDFVAPAAGCPTQVNPSVGFGFVRGTAAKGGALSGVFLVQSFAVRQGTLVATGKLIGSLVRTKAVRAVNQTVTLPVQTKSGTSTKSVKRACRILHLSLGPLDLNLQGPRVHLNRVGLDIEAQSGSGNLLENLLCAVADLVNGRNPVQALANVLNELVATATKPNVTGTATSGETFRGTFTPRRFAVEDGELVAKGLLNGTLTDSAGKTKTVTGKSVGFPVAAPNTTGACQILHLSLGPLDLNLLGLRVHLNRVALDIRAQSGPGNLPGNLLCSLANALNGREPLQIAADLLNQLIKPRAT